MLNNKNIFYFIRILILLSLSIQTFPQKITLENEQIKRMFNIGDRTKLSTIYYGRTDDSSNYVLAENKEFSFRINDKEYSGLSRWDVSFRDTSDCLQSKGIVFQLNSNDSTDFTIQITYMAYKDIPVIKKQISFHNNGSNDIKLEALDIENLKINWNPTETWIMRYYGRYKHLGAYIGDWNDPIITVHDLEMDRGISIGNEIPGVIKRSTALVDGKSITSGFTHPEQAFGFRKWIYPGETWNSPAVFTALYSKTSNPYTVLNTTVADYVRKYMGTRYEQLSQKPMFIYNTWVPFTTNINNTLILELADAAASCGVEEFIIDDGWQVCNGDWIVNSNKFPEGLKSIFDHIRSLGMKPGLWISLATAKLDSHIYQNHPEWFVEDKNGNKTNLHSDDIGSSATACLGTGWKEHIKQVIRQLVQKHGLAYSKLDLAMITSAYVYDLEKTGCYSGKHPEHKDHEESYETIYRKCMEVLDELHAEFPELFIDCTFETAGKLQLNDYGIIKHAEGNWLSNIPQSGAQGAFRARLLAWQRSPTLPASTLVIGNLLMNDAEYELALKSLAGTLPIMLGDPRKLSNKDRRNYKQWISWLKALEQRHKYTSFRQDLPGFGEPSEGCWDGFARINTETKSGGLIGVFRQGSKERSRIVTINYLDPNKQYSVREGKTNKIITTKSGKQLETTGFHVSLEKDYDGQLFEIREQ